LLADKHHVPKGRFKNLSQPLPQQIKEKIKERNIIRIANHSDFRIPQLGKALDNCLNWTTQNKSMETIFRPNW